MKEKTSPKVSAPRSVKRQQAKEKIFNAAMTLLDEYGYEYITVNNICEVAGISVGNFYHYFEGKDELLSHFFIASYEKFLDEQTPEETGDPIEDIISFFCAYSDFCQDQGLDFVRHFYSPYNRSLEMSMNQSSEEHFALPSLNATEKKIIAGQKNGLFDPNADPMTIANDICTIEKGAIFEWCVSNGGFNIRTLTKRLLTQYLRGYQIKK